MEPAISGVSTAKLKLAIGVLFSVVCYWPEAAARAQPVSERLRLRNAYVAASIFADEVVLEDCVAIGGVFATRNLEIRNCVVGPFNSPTVHASQTIYLVLPSAFPVESVSVLPGTELICLALADLGGLMRGLEEAPRSGKIRIGPARDERRTVLAADLLDLDRLRNHFLLSAAGLGSQLLCACGLGPGADGKPVDLNADRISAFLFDILHGRIPISDLDARFSLDELAGAMQAQPEHVGFRYL